METPILKDRPSGYAASVENWRTFLNCWHTEAVKKSSAKGGRQGVSVLSKYSHLSAESEPSEAEIERGIALAELRLGVALPLSYKDFACSYRPPRYRPHEAAGGGTLRVGFYGLDQIDTLGRLEPQLDQIGKQIPIHSRDAQYYVYGIDQDDVAIRTANRTNAIVVGSHGPEMHDLILLYPQEEAKDGELEASLLFHSGEFRAPSFAELMRQMSFMETRDVKHVPPYRQVDIAGSCAGLLPMLNVWWK